MSSNTVVQGEAGTGKSYFACGCEEPIRYFNLEDGEEDKNNRLEKLIIKYYSDRVIDRVHLCKVYLKDTKVGKIDKKAYEIDGISSLKAFISEVDKLIYAKFCDYRTVVVDGITPLRDFAHELWCLQSGRIHAVNPGDWSEVNDIVRDKLQPLVKWGKRQGVSIVFTAQMKDDYQKIIKTDKAGKKVEDSIKAGRIGNYKEWEAYDVNTIIELVAEKDAAKRPTGKYFALCDKSLAGSWTENITGKSLFEILQEKGI